MNNYVPKVGDNVRATLGENVLVGEVSAEYAGDIIELLVSEDEEVCISAEHWQFEQVVSVPTKFGAVIRRADGIMLSLADPYDTEDVCTWLTAGDGEGRGIGWFSNAEATAGGFTVLFEGVDE